MEKKTPKKSRKTVIILTMILILGTGTGGYAWINSSAYEKQTMQIRRQYFFSSGHQEENF